MIEIELDGNKLAVAEGCTVMHAAEQAGTYIPHFCYHKKLSIAANCRMCLVEIEKMPKPMPACATPVTQGMVVRTKSDKAIKAQKSVMEFLLVNHPLDCPICDQGGECQLQDLAVGYGGSASRYAEEKRVVFHKNIGPLVSMEEMSRCIHCTRCVRFGQEVAGVMELGMSHRGEHSEIEAFVGATVDSELSGNMIDVCPVGALTSKPFRYSARTWELSRRRSVSPHDSTGANLVVQVKNNKVMRVVPFENDAVNECWIADRDRFSYEALNSPERLTQPMVKQGGVWQAVEWTTALEYVANGLQDVVREHGATAVGAWVSPHSTVEELYLAKQLLAGLGSHSIDYRLRHAAYPHNHGARWLGLPIADLSHLDRVLVVGSNLRKDHPLFAQRIRQASRRGAAVHALVSTRELSNNDAWAIKLATAQVTPAQDWLATLASVAAAVAQSKGIAAPHDAPVTDAARAVAQSLATGQRKAILLGNAAAHSAQSEALLSVAQWLATQTGASVGYFTEAANTVGAQLVGAVPTGSGLNAAQMLEMASPVQAMLLLNTEPEFDSRMGAAATSRMAAMKMVVGLTPFKTNLDCCDVLLPISPFTETSGTFVNAEGRVQSFTAVVSPLGETRPAWKVLRVLATLLGQSHMQFATSTEVLQAALPGVSDQQIVASGLLNNHAAQDAGVAEVGKDAGAGVPCTAAIYQLDGIVRRATSLQLTADAKRSGQEERGLA